MELQPGARIDRYVVLSVLGRGGMATVYLVRHEALPTHYALKVLDLPSRIVRDRLVAEGLAQASLKHPNVVQVHDTLVVEGCPALLLEHVDGPALDAMLGLTRFSLEEVDHLVVGVLKGVRAAHQHGLVHRDLKPGNILLAQSDDGFVPKITDFGLAKTTSDVQSAGPSHTRTGQVMGTPAYMAPEQFKNAKDADVRADIWALGVILYELVTGHRPFHGDDLFDLYEQVFAGTYAPPDELAPGLPVRIQKAIRGALVVDREQRIADVDELLATWRGRDASLMDAPSANFRKDTIEHARRLVNRRPPEAIPVLRPPVTPAVSTATRQQRERSLGRILAAIGMGTGLFGLVVGGLGLAAAILVGLGTFGRQPAEPVPPEPAVAVPVVALEPAPLPVAAPEPAPPETRPPGDEAVKPDPRAPSPRPAPTGPAPAPTPTVDAGGGRFAVTGDRPERVSLSSAGKAWSEGARIPPGIYTLEFQFPGKASQQATVPVTVVADRTTTIKCSLAFGSCKPL